MNKIKKLLVFIVLALSLVFAFSFSEAKAYTYTDLDRIQLYEIKVTPKKDDGSLDIEIHLIWEVVDSYTDGPLEWIKVGIPNYHAKDIKALSDGIRKIKYYADDGSYIRIDFKKSHYEGEVLDIRFSYNQSYMYHLNEAYVVYDYHPGWFEEIKVDMCNLYWAIDGVDQIAEGITSANGITFSEEDGYYKLSSPLNYGGTIKMRLRYANNYFNELDPKKEYTDKYTKPVTIILIVAAIVTFLAIVIALYYYQKSQQDPYMNERGFCTGYYHWYLFNRPHRYYGKTVNSKGARIVNPSTSGGSHGGFSGGGGCACACACACAGGGRAGCSKKDFYNTNLKSDVVLKELDK